MKIMVSLILLFLLVIPYELKKLKSTKTKGDSTKLNKTKQSNEDYMIRTIDDKLENIKDLYEKVDDQDLKAKLMEILTKKRDTILDIRLKISQLFGEMIILEDESYSVVKNFKKELNHYKSLESLGRKAESDGGSDISSSSLDFCQRQNNQPPTKECSWYIRLKNFFRKIWKRRPYYFTNGNRS